MANGSTSSMNRMKTLTDKMKAPPGSEVTYDAAGYAINPDKSTEELTKGTTVLPTVNVEAKGDRYAKSFKKGKLRKALVKGAKAGAGGMEEKYKRAGEFNKYAMETGISPNFDAMPDSSRTQAMTDFYSDKSNVRKMNRLQKQYFRKKK